LLARRLRAMTNCLARKRRAAPSQATLVDGAKSYLAHRYFGASFRLVSRNLRLRFQASLAAA
jgi:hypothetical protein